MAKQNNYPTPEQLAEWKEKHGGKEVTIEDKKCWLSRPSLKIMKSVFSSSTEQEQKEILVKNCWLAGDPELKTDADYFQDLCEIAWDLLKDMPEYDLERLENGIRQVSIEGKVCKLRKPTREDIMSAETRNKRKTPFLTNQYLLDMIWLDGDEELRTNDCYLIPLLAAVDEAKKNRIATIKNL